MRILPSLACVSMMALLAACGAPTDGYYDANGRFIESPNSEHPFEHDVTLRDHMRNANRAHAYDRRGYYDANGNYIDQDMDEPNVPASMFPSRGMCRVWFTDRDYTNQPPVETCKHIRTRVPAGAYVIYGG